ncbi:hypothetical protein F5Y19DRAFT_477895 [Xylariaceae sp. FL1651]|nr:hypothetical protein F5Y19DRAFT_477895 [Xylariaceae sp. FL1651]
MPGPVTIGIFYYTVKRQRSVPMCFTSDPTQGQAGHRRWGGDIDIKCEDVPRLTRKGFHWSTASIAREEGYLELAQRDSLAVQRTDFAMARHYLLQDLQTSCPLGRHDPNLRCFR